MDQQSLNQELAQIVAKCRKLADQLRRTWGNKIVPITHPILEEFERLEAEANGFVAGEPITARSATVCEAVSPPNATSGAGSTKGDSGRESSGR